ncbi:MAG: phosphatidylserine decarboxylase [Gammaproteobacteria bacterium]|nr:phosphatidylserine decarboxylase [Gammaproteobacteria bacterium]MCK5262556.1 phosphatidylserine decarboxylase [Gammaproteobacteria bacterium]
MKATLRDYLLSTPFYILPHHGISWLMFKLARIQFRPVKDFIIRAYTKFNAVKMHEAVIEDKYAYESLNAFFTRALKPECRPFDDTENSWLCPVDGAVSQARKIENGRVFQAKGHDYSLLELVGGDEKLAAAFQNGNFATIYLSPRDYHRIHMPIGGELTNMTYIPGRLFSVADHTVKTVPRLFARNERVACFFDTEHGPMVMILVGAINVSATETVWHGLVTSKDKKINSIDYKKGEVTLERGDEMGRFNLGSTVIVLTTEQFELDELMTHGKEVKLGQRLGIYKP